MPRTALKPRKIPRQMRSSATVGTILEAAARVLDRGGLAAFNTNAVAARAGVSVGSLYQYFPNKSAIVAALILREQRALADGLGAIRETMRGRRLEEAVDALIRAGIAAQSSRPRYALALDHEEARLPLGPAIEAERTRTRAAIADLLAEHRARLAPGTDPGHAAADVLTMARALIDEAAQARAAPDWADVETRVRRAILGYLAGG
ncbi:MAG: TetR/AcrR family transcriptional regulator [Tagaea sp.]